jgi:hypothetical protein
LLYFVRYRDKKDLSVLTCVFRAPLHRDQYMNSMDIVLNLGGHIS